MFVVIQEDTRKEKQNMARRGENIRKRKDGRWEARFIEGYAGDKAKYRCVYGKTYAEVKAKREELVVKLVSNSLPPAKKLITIGWVSGDWLKVVKKRVKESTFSRYDRIVRMHILPEFGETYISKVDVDCVNCFSERLCTTLSPKTVTDILSVLKQVLLHAEKTGCKILDLKLITTPKRSNKQIKLFSEASKEDLENILWGSENDISVGIVLTLYTGIRIGELCGLKWSDINFRDGTVHIMRTVERISDFALSSNQKTKVVITEPKTEHSNRIIPLPGFLLEYLQTKRKSANSYIISGMDKPSEPHTVYIRYTRFLKSNGLDSHTFHALRHTFATNCVEAGFDTKSLSEILGHSNVSTTLRCYVHPSMEAKRAQMERLAPAVISGQKYGH